MEFTINNMLMFFILIILIVSEGAPLKPTQAGEGGGGFNFQNLFGGLQLKLHGHYCGLNHGDGTYKTGTVSICLIKIVVVPVDEVDQACMDHDKCYDRGYLDCQCDAEFLASLGKLKIPKMKSTIDLMKNWFEKSACSCLGENGIRSQLEGNVDLRKKKRCKKMTATERTEL